MDKTFSLCSNNEQWGNQADNRAPGPNCRILIECEVFLFG